MTPWNPLEERLQRLEAGPYLCPECGHPWNNPDSADRCCPDERPRRRVRKD